MVAHTSLSFSFDLQPHGLPLNITHGIPRNTIFMACDKYCYFFLLRSVHTRRQVAATSRGNRSLCVQVRRLVAATRYGDMSQQRVAATCRQVCTLVFKH